MKGKIQRLLELQGGPLDGGVIIWPEDRPFPELYWFPHLDDPTGGGKRHIYQQEIQTEATLDGLLGPRRYAYRGIV